MRRYALSNTDNNMAEQLIKWLSGSRARNLFQDAWFNFITLQVILQIFVSKVILQICVQSSRYLLLPISLLICMQNIDYQQAFNCCAGMRCTGDGILLGYRQKHMWIETLAPADPAAPEVSTGLLCEMNKWASCVCFPSVGKHGSCCMCVGARLSLR